MRARAIGSFVAMLERMPLVEAAYWLSTAYSDLSSEEYRAKLAMYFTPPPIANRLMEDLEKVGARFEEQRFIDPACGGAAFLAVVASRMREKLIAIGMRPAARLRHAETHLAGVDLEGTLCALSRHFLRMVFYSEICASRRKPKFRITCADSLSAYRSFRNTYDVVICNPPFRKLKADEAERYRSSYADVMQGQPNLYALFINLTVRLAKKHGLVGLVTPTSFLSGQYSCAVRTFLLTNTQIQHIGLVSERERVYLDVEQDTALTVLSADPPQVGKSASPAVSVVDREGRYIQIGSCHLPNSGSSWPLARDAKDISLIEAASRSRFRISDYGYTPVVGCFVWNRDRRPAYMTFDKVPRTKRATVVPLLWSSDVSSGGRLQFDRQTSAHGQHRYVDFKGLDHPAVRSRPGVLLQRVTSSEQPRRLVGAVVSERFLREHGGYVGENHVVILEQVNPDIGIAPRTLLKLLETRAADRYFRCISGSSNVSVFELAQLPLPDPSELKRMLDRGESIDDAAAKLLQGSARLTSRTRTRARPCAGIAA
jgi:adenine-specific DNA-methyltransferase